ncbi:MAG: hypothetical protein IJX81_05465 [Clostridia bacterium]|nr:hypothetical protein [Clostridia bacterium]
MKNGKRRKRFTEALYKNLKETSKALVRQYEELKSLGEDAEGLLFLEVNEKYPALLIDETELTLLFVEAGARMIAERYLSEFSEEDFDELEKEAAVEEKN